MTYDLLQQLIPNHCFTISNYLNPVDFPISRELTRSPAGLVNLIFYFGPARPDWLRPAQGTLVIIVKTF
jgi:hypothetical protein